MQSSMPAVWVKMSSSWLGLGLFLWTLVAPVIFPDRDFSWACSVFKRVHFTFSPTASHGESYKQNRKHIMKWIHVISFIAFSVIVFFLFYSARNDDFMSEPPQMFLKLSGFLWFGWLTEKLFFFLCELTLIDNSPPSAWCMCHMMSYVVWTFFFFFCFLFLVCQRLGNKTFPGYLRHFTFRFPFKGLWCQTSLIGWVLNRPD